MYFDQMPSIICSYAFLSSTPRKEVSFAGGSVTDRFLFVNLAALTIFKAENANAFFHQTILCCASSQSQERLVELPLTSEKLI